jgi:hypothetical protein
MKRRNIRIWTLSLILIGLVIMVITVPRISQETAKKALMGRKVSVWNPSYRTEISTEITQKDLGPGHLGWMEIPLPFYLDNLWHIPVGYKPVWVIRIFEENWDGLVDAKTGEVLGIYHPVRG